MENATLAGGAGGLRRVHAREVRAGGMEAMAWPWRGTCTSGRDVRVYLVGGPRGRVPPDFRTNLEM